jgi:hypothetical protein
MKEVKKTKVEIDSPEGKPEKVVKRMWNKNFIPKYKDGIIRYQDPENGLWKRLNDWQRKEFTNKDTGVVEMKLSPGFMPVSAEIFEDKIGRYYVAVNGMKVYKFDKDIPDGRKKPG